MDCVKKTRRANLIQDQELTVDRKVKIPGGVDLIILRLALDNVKLMMLDRGMVNAEEIPVDVPDFWIGEFHNRTLKTIDSSLFPFSFPRISTNLFVFLLRKTVPGDVDLLLHKIEEWKKNFPVVGTKILTLCCNFLPERKKLARKFTDPSYHIQSFSVDELARSTIFYSPSRHFLIPDSSLLSYKEVGELEKSLREKQWSLDNLPAISSSDPYAKFHGLVPGEIVRFYRQSSTGDGIINESIFYRRIVGLPMDDAFVP
jgi:DNA-directed RNA polymerase subunit H (RpoH/RPB5)